MFYYIKWCYYSLSDTMISCQFKVIKTYTGSSERQTFTIKTSKNEGLSSTLDKNLLNNDYRT